MDNIILLLDSDAPWPKDHIYSLKYEEDLFPLKSVFYKKYNFRKIITLLNSVTKQRELLKGILKGMESAIMFCDLNGIDYYIKFDFINLKGKRLTLQIEILNNGLLYIHHIIHDMCIPFPTTHMSTEGILIDKEYMYDITSWTKEEILQLFPQSPDMTHSVNCLCIMTTENGI